MASGFGDIRVNDAAINVGMNYALPVWLKVVTDEVTAGCVVGCPVGKDDPLGRPRVGPHMQDSISGQIVGSGPTLRGVVTANKEYAMSVHNGARAHEIPTGGESAQRAKGYRLRFLKDGTVRMPWSVRHPGNQNPNPWMLRALVAVTSRLR